MLYVTLHFDLTNGDGGSRTHVQRYRHLSIYERIRHISHSLFHSLPAGIRTASLIRLFLHPQTAESGVAH